MMKWGVLSILIFALTATLAARANDQEKGAVASSQLQRRAYPGGHDESDLTVQPHKKVTRKQADSESDRFEVEPEADASGVDEGFGE